jgi:hypothetical protein
MYDHSLPARRGKKKKTNMATFDPKNGQPKGLDIRLHWIGLNICLGALLIILADMIWGL